MITQLTTKKHQSKRNTAAEGNANPKKPVKWRFKNFVCVGSSEMIYDFFLYTGSSNKPEK